MISIYSYVLREEKEGERTQRKKESSLHVMHVCLIKIKLYIYLKLNEVLNVFISREGERLREIEQQHRYVYIQCIRKISVCLFICIDRQREGEEKSRISFYICNL